MLTAMLTHLSLSCFISLGFKPLLRDVINVSLSFHQSHVPSTYPVYFLQFIFTYYMFKKRHLSVNYVLHEPFPTPALWSTSHFRFFFQVEGA